jgi:hypothetical protein
MIEGSRLRDRRGVSLPLVILMMALLALAVTAGFSRVSEERRIVGDQQAQVDAFAVAESGLERYVALMDSQPVPNDSIAIPIGARDTAFVALFQIRPPNGAPGLYVIRSRGVSHSAPRYSATTPPAQRTVAQYATWQGMSMDVDAAWTAIAGLRSQSNTGTLDGNDNCATPGPAVAGIAVPEFLVVPPAQFPTGFSAPPNPVPFTRTLGGPGSFPATAEADVHIDWNAIVNTSVLQPDYTLTGVAGWPPYSASVWPVIRVDGSVTLTGGQSGHGLIVVTGDLTITTGFTWAGVILVGRRLVVTGQPAVDGVMVSGLDVKLGAQFAESNSGENAGDAINLHYNSCNVAAALSRYGHLTLVANAWTDSWPEN